MIFILIVILFIGETKKLLSVRKNKIHFSQTVSLFVKRFPYTLKQKRGDN